MRVLLALACLLGSIGWVPAAIPAAPNYRLGDIARETVTTPVRLVVTNATERERLRRLEARKTPPVFRYCPEGNTSAVEQFRAAFAEYRQRFRTNWIAASQGRPFTAHDLAHPTVAQFVQWYKKWNPAFPLSSNLVRAWILGESDQAIENAMQNSLRSALRLHLCANNVSLDNGVPAVRLVRVKSLAETVDLPAIERRSQLVNRSSLLTVAQARNTLIASSPADQKDTVRFLGYFLRENCVPAPDLTTRLQDQRAASAATVQTYRAGQAVVQAGQAIDAKALAALQALESMPEHEPGVTPATASAIGEPLGSVPAVRWSWLKVTQRRHLWWLVVLVAGLGVLFWFFKQRKRGRSVRTRYIGSAGSFTVMGDAPRNETVLLPLRRLQPSAAAKSPSARSLNSERHNAEMEAELAGDHDEPRQTQFPLDGDAQELPPA